MQQQGIQSLNPSINQSLNSWWLEYYAGLRGCGTGMVWRRDDLQQLVVELNSTRRSEKNFLQHTFLSLALVALLLLFGLLNFFHQVALTIAMQPGPSAVFAQGAGNILLVYLKTGEHKQLRKVSRQNGNDQKQYGDAAELHCFANVGTGADIGKGLGKKKFWSRGICCTRAAAIVHRDLIFF